MRFIDVRCDGTRRGGYTAGARCNGLLLRRSEDLTGKVETKCPQCNTTREWRFEPMMAMST